jgi:HK97 gp10 family phage protein
MAVYISALSRGWDIYSKGVERGIREGLKRMQKRIAREMDTPKSGITYSVDTHPFWVGKRPSPHTASDDGETPANWTGELKEAVLDPEAVEVKKSGTTIVAQFKVDSPYAHFLEFGTQKMSPRPWFGNAFDQMREPLKSNLGSVMAAESKTIGNRARVFQIER